MTGGWLLPVSILLPVGLAGILFLLSSAKAILRLTAAGTLGTALVSMVAVWLTFSAGSLNALGNWLRLDALSAYHLIVMMAVFALSSVYSIFYFGEEIARGHFDLSSARRFGALWFGSLSAMLIILLSNNLGIMWVGVEATTLLTAFLICVHSTPGALEAMWKYLLMCSVGVAVAFFGILLIAASTKAAGLHGSEALFWTDLLRAVHKLDPTLLKVGFLFLVIGYGTKAGLAPMHNWLPDAHSQAPSPVSALFSGFLLNAALYCILRVLPLVEAATGQVGWGREVLVVFGLLSIVTAAIFIIAQKDIKRLLAYSSVEHLGIIALGIGAGGLGAVAALLHIMNHSLAKSLSFFSAGRLGQFYGTHDIRQMTRIMRVSPVWGAGLLGGLLAVLGLAPFALFLSEWLILKALLDNGNWWSAGLFLAGIAVVFVGVLRQVIAMAWDSPREDVASSEGHPLEFLLVGLPLVVLLLLGLWIPNALLDVLTQAAAILGGGR